MIKPALEIKCTKQFDEMLTIMECSDDYTVKYLFGEIQKFMQPADSEVCEKPSSAKGNCYGVVHIVLID